MRAPRFWSNPPDAAGVMAHALAPLAALYALGTAKRLRSPVSYNPAVPVICIGNINAGGTGKTPTVIAIVQRLLEMGHTPHIISRGFGGSLQGPALVDPLVHNADQTGDEPLLLAAFAPTWVATDRSTAAPLAVASGATILIMDDGFQNPSLRKDLSIIVVDAQTGFGNGRVIPAGPLREPVTVGLARGDVLLSIGNAAAQTTFKETWGTQISLPHVTAQLEPLQTGIDWKGQRVVAFAGIGHPEKFFATLRALGCDIAHAEALSDHQPLNDGLLTRLSKVAKQKDAQLVTTEKDAVRLPAAMRTEVLTVPVRLSITNWDVLNKAICTLVPPKK